MFVASAGSSRVCLCRSVTNRLLLPLHIYSQLSFHSFCVSSRQLQIVNTLVLFYSERSDPRHVQTSDRLLFTRTPPDVWSWLWRADECVRSVGRKLRASLPRCCVCDGLARNQIIVERAGQGRWERTCKKSMTRWRLQLFSSLLTRARFIDYDNLKSHLKTCLFL